MADILDRFETEVKRGAIQIAIMCLLEQERYGYDIIKNLKDAGLIVEEVTLYSILRRLDDEKLLSSRWETSGPRPRKYYVITDYGRSIREKLLVSMKSIAQAVDYFESHMEGDA
jgi:PadR family transcriptional regulator, regulatory protein PadR